VKTYPLLLAALLGLSQCKKTEPAAPRPEDQLPPATQNGTYAFGFLLNGQPWTPKGSNGTDNYQLVYDPGYRGGSLQIRAYRYLPSQTENQYILMTCTPLSKPGTYPLDGVAAGVYYKSGIKGSCYEYDKAPGLSMSGQLVVTRLDLSAGIVSGTFAFTLSQPGCDTIKATYGRFDKKL